MTKRIFKHYKNKKLYEYIGTAEPMRIEFGISVLKAKLTESKDLKEIDIYCYGDKLFTKENVKLSIYKDDSGIVWARPSKMFFEMVKDEDGESVPRFRKMY